MSNIVEIPTDINNIKAGDTVMIDGQLRTVGKNNIKYGGFMGTSLFGDSSKRTITKVLFAVPTNNGIVYR